MGARYRKLTPDATTKRFVNFAQAVGARDIQLTKQGRATIRRRKQHRKLLLEGD